MKPQEAMDNLLSHGKEIAHLGSAVAVLHWDQRTQIPRKGHRVRADVLSTMAGIIHKMATDPKIGEWLAIVEHSALTKDPRAIEAVNIP